MSLAARQARYRQQTRALSVRVSVTHEFRHEDLAAVGSLIGYDEPSRIQLRRFMVRAIELAVREARERYEKSLEPEELDVPF
jgi:hypothetical protein